MNDYNFGNFVCMLREKKGLTQADVASAMGVTPAAVSKWENGSSKPRVEVLFRLAELLGVKPEELMAGKYLEEETELEKWKKYMKIPKLGKKGIIILLSSVLGGILIITALALAIVFAVMNAQKNTAEYQMAYEYVVNSKAFAEAGIEEKDLRFNSYSHRTGTGANGERIYEAEYGFTVGFKKNFTVILHKSGESWYVCEDCTHFE